MPKPPESLAPKRIGYLRHVPASTALARPGGGPAKAMWSKLASTGHVEIDASGAFRRTTLGDEAVADFDGNLSEACIAVLEAVRDRSPNVAGMRGVATLIDADLIHVGERTMRYGLNEDAEAILDRNAPRPGP